MTSPAWRKAWKIDDPEWQKRRRSEWKKIVKCPGFVHGGANKTARGYIKNYFLTGSAFDPELPEEEWRYMRYHPINSPLPIANSTLFEVWLSADQSELHLQSIRERSDELTYMYSRELISSLFVAYMPEQGGIFLEADERIYRFFTPIRFRKQDYQGIKDDEFNRLARGRLGSFGNAIEMYMADVFNPDNIAPVLLDEWADCIVPAFLYFTSQDMDESTYMSNFTTRIDRAIAVVNKPDKFETEQVEFAKDLLSRFEKLDMPEELAERLTSHLTA